MLGADVKLCGPKSLIPKHIEALGVTVSTDLIQSLKWCDAVNMLRVQNERMDLNYFPSTREYAQLYGLNAQKLASLKKEIVLLHPGPINRGWKLPPTWPTPKMPSFWTKLKMELPLEWPLSTCWLPNSIYRPHDLRKEGYSYIPKAWRTKKKTLLAL